MVPGPFAADGFFQCSIYRARSEISLPLELDLQTIVNFRGPRKYGALNTAGSWVQLVNHKPPRKLILLEERRVSICDVIPLSCGLMEFVGRLECIF